jgi:PhnB protein
MTHHVKHTPEGYHAVTTSLTVKGADKAIAWYGKVFGAKLKNRMASPDGKAVWHAEIQIGDTVLMLADEDPNMGGKSPETLGGASSSLWHYTPDVDALYAKATAAGATLVRAPENMFWGDRTAQVIDPYGQPWGLATHVEDVSPDEAERRGKEWAAKMASSR